MRLPRLTFPAWLASLTLYAAASALCAQSGAPNAVVAVDFSNPGLSPAHWTLTLHRDGSGHFRSERGDPPANSQQAIDTPNVDRDIQVSTDFAGRIFQAAKEHNWFNEQCESHLKVAFQGWKKFSYSGPGGHGTCTFNYSKDKEIQELGDSLNGVAETLIEGARLETLLQHDRLGLDKEMESMIGAVKDGRMRQICSIREILEKLAGDSEVLERVRKRARFLLDSDAER
jgi:hypothetical protein